MRKIFVLLIFIFIAITVTAQNDVIEGMEESRLLAVVDYSENHMPQEWYAFSIRDDAGVASLAYSHPDILAVVRIELIQLVNPEDYYGDSYFDTIYQGYSPYEFVASCDHDVVILHIHEGEFEDNSYIIHHYTAVYSEDNYWNISLFFPKESYQDLLEVAEGFFPDLLTCEEDEN